MDPQRLSAKRKNVVGVKMKMVGCLQKIDYFKIPVKTKKSASANNAKRCCVKWKIMLLKKVCGDK